MKFDGGMHAITNVSTGAGESVQGLSLAKGTMVVEGGATVMTTANSMYAANSGVDMYVAITSMRSRTTSAPSRQDARGSPSRTRERSS